MNHLLLQINNFVLSIFGLIGRGNNKRLNTYSWFYKKTAPSVYTLLINCIYLSLGTHTQVAAGTIFRKHTVLLLTNSKHTNKEYHNNKLMHLCIKLSLKQIQAQGRRLFMALLGINCNGSDQFGLKLFWYGLSKIK